MTRRTVSSDPTEAVSLELESFSVTPVSRARIIYGVDVVDAASAPD